MTSSYTAQKFISPTDGTTVALRVNTSDNSILWRHILKSFGNVHKVQVDDMDIHFMMNDQFEDILPLRIEAAPDLIMKVILSKEPVKKKNQAVEHPPKYDEGPSCIEQICSAVLPFASHTRDPGDLYIRFGSRISLRHVSTGSYLRSTDIESSTYPWRYDVRGVCPRDPGLYDFWQVVPPEYSPEDCNKLVGNTIRYGASICLHNVATKRVLYFFKAGSPATPLHEAVTRMDRRGEINDNTWVVERLESGTEYWRTTDLFTLRYKSTNHFLHSRSNVNMAEHEVIGSQTYSDFNNIWRAQLV
ncbi:hypothetical protein BGZ76_001937 [Entomortierella beljakovae]|nr:hypothetical protein BGZ76_001937 [Entomortierella beljakovae]